MENQEHFEHKIAQLLRRQKTSVYCDACLALDLKASLQDTRQAALHLASSGAFERKQRVCDRCQRTLEMTCSTDV